MNRQDFGTETLILVVSVPTGGFFSQSEPTPYNIIGLGQQGKNHAYEAEISGCLQGKGLAATGNEAGTLVLHGWPTIAFSSKDDGRDAASEISPTLRSMNFDKSHLNGGGQVAVAIPIDMRQASRGGTMTNNRRDDAASGVAPGTGIGEAGDPSPTIAGTHTPAVAAPFIVRTNAAGQADVSDKAAALINPTDSNYQFVVSTLKGAEAGGTSDMRPCVAGGSYRVRRLMPVECERLQGFPDGWTKMARANPFTASGESPISDSARYRMLGNAVTVPVAAWIGRRIAHQIEREGE